jgi:hypothetical protein
MVAVLQVLHSMQGLLGFLLCLIVLISSVDRVPDLPGLRPPGCAVISIGIGSQNVPLINHDRDSGAVSWVVTERVRFVDWNLLFADKVLLRSPIYLRRASNSSPPIGYFGGHQQLCL